MRKSLLEVLTISFSQYFIEPDIVAALSIRFTVARAVTDFPEPLSPTNATVSPFFIEKVTSLTALCLPKLTDKFFILKMCFI